MMSVSSEHTGIWQLQGSIIAESLATLRSETLGACRHSSIGIGVHMNVDVCTLCLGNLSEVLFYLPHHLWVITTTLCHPNLLSVTHTHFIVTWILPHQSTPVPRRTACLMLGLPISPTHLLTLGSWYMYTPTLDVLITTTSYTGTSRLSVKLQPRLRLPLHPSTSRFSQ